MPGLLSICELDDSSDDEGNICDNVSNNKNWSDKGLDYADNFSEEDNCDENSMTNDEMSDLIGGYESDQSPIEG